MKLKIVSSVAICALLAGCSLPAAGPRTAAIVGMSDEVSGRTPVQLVDVNELVADRLRENVVARAFSDSFVEKSHPPFVIGRGDVLGISIWESPPAVLFGSVGGGEGGLNSSMGNNGSIARNSQLPEQMVDQSGLIQVPFAGAVPAAGRAPSEIAQTIVNKLRGKAHDPQVVVHLVRNSAANITIVGDVVTSGRMPLTAKGERLLDALASAGGTKQPVGKMTVQITRGAAVEVMPLEAIIKDPRQNVRLEADDVITLLFQPYSFTALGASRANQEVPFEGVGLTLSQALGRIGGLDDQRANPKGVFIFRFEDPHVFANSEGQHPATTKDGKVPVIYRVDMKDPKTLFVAQSFPIKDRDVIYISNAPLADFSKFLQAVSQIVYPIATIQNTNIF